MRLSTVFELLLIFLLIAFAAYGRVIDHDGTSRAVGFSGATKQTNMGVNIMSLKQAAENVNKYCTCNENICNCCRDFNIPIVSLKGPGCASLQYLEKEKLAVQLSMGDNILTSTVVNGQKPRAVCFPMPGGLTKFCGRIYSIKREANDHFKACLALELQSSAELEAALRVSCFRFGPDGVKLRPAERLPIVEVNAPPEEEDDDDDIFGLGDDDDDEDDEDPPEGNAVSDPASTNSEDDDDDDDDDDLLGFGALLDIFTGDDGSNKKKKKPEVTTSAPTLPFTIPILTKPVTTVSPIPAIVEHSETLAESVKPIATTPKPLITDNGISTNDVATDEVTSSEADHLEESTSSESSEALHTEETFSEPDTSAVSDELSSTEASANNVEIIGNLTDIKEQAYISEPEKQPVSLKKITASINKKPSLTSSGINAIKTDDKKPLSSVIIHKVTPKPVENNHVAALESNEDEEETEDVDLFSDEDDDDDNLEESDEDENDEDDHKDDEKLETVNEDSEENDKVEEHHNEEEDELIDDDDEDDVEEEEEEDAVLTALVDDDTHDNQKISDKVADNEATNHEEDDADYGLGLAELLARKRHMRSGRQSKVMRL